MYEKKRRRDLRRVKIEIASPLRVFSALFRGRKVGGCMRHATAKFGSLVHRFGMIMVGLHARDFSKLIFGLFGPPKSGVF